VPRVKLDGKKLLELALELNAAARAVSRSLKENEAGDAVEYHGSMQTANWLEEAIQAFEDYRTMGEP
jgi:hypothetical protein